MLQGLETGHATLGVVGTVSRSLVPPLVAEIAARRARRVAAPHRGRVGAARGRGRRARARERGRHRAGRATRGSSSSTCATKRSSALVPAGARRSARDEPVPLDALASTGLILPPDGQPAARRGRDVAARPSTSTLRVPIEVEGIRLIADLVAAGAGRVDPARDGGRRRRRRRARTSRIVAHAAAPARARHARAACSSRSPTKPCTTSCARLVREHASVADAVRIAGTKRVPTQRRPARRGLRPRAGRRRASRRGCSSRPKPRAARPHEIGASSPTRRSTSPCSTPREEAERRRQRTACAARRGATSRAAPRAVRDRPTSAGACSGRARRTCASSSARAPDGRAISASCTTVPCASRGMQERFLPLRVGEVDVHRVEARRRARARARPRGRAP